MPKAGRFLIAVICCLYGMAADGEYLIYDGLDFANGRSARWKAAGAGEPAWVRYGGYVPGGELLKQYGLGYGKPILSASSARHYTFQWFLLRTNRAGWRVWRWDVWFLCHAPDQIGCGVSLYRPFFEILRESPPPEEEVRAMYAECIRLYETLPGGEWHEATRAYLAERYRRHMAPKRKEHLARMMENPSGFSVVPQEEIDYLQEHRAEYPGELPSGFMHLLLNAWSGKPQAHPLFREYLASPTRRNALFLGLFLTQRDSPDENLIIEVFRELEAHELDARFAKQTTLPDMPELPAVSLPVRLRQHGLALAFRAAAPFCRSRFMKELEKGPEGRP